MTEPGEECHVPRLQDYCHRVILANIESVRSTGDMPFRVIRPVLEKCKVHKLLQLELGSPHLKNDTQVIWKKKCLDEFIDIRQGYESGSMPEPTSWRKQYVIAQEERERKISSSASRLRGMYQDGESSKRGRQTIYTTKAPPPKRGRFGSFGISKPRTLIDKARQDTKKIQHVWTGPSGSSGPVARRKTVPLGQNDLFRPRPTQSVQPHPNSASLVKKSGSGSNASQSSSATENRVAAGRLQQKPRQFEGSFVD
ncbi:hypothetical protein BDV93DRAFT_482820 [Ceratobasidium sp. AG-I]|nr:hypothetical protein BDV93DRAFT_482820 [Ceratobasidium sp. AG-I]